jgi:cyclophilin family peptidyl-prolyl cis-trans isomerase
MSHRGMACGGMAIARFSLACLVAASAVTFGVQAQLPAASAVPPVTQKRLLPAEVLAASPASDWRIPDPDSTLYLTLPAGRVVIELAPAFAPAHVENIRALVREVWYEGVAIVRVQDNYVTQWGMPEETPKPMRTAREKLAPEFVWRPSLVPGQPTVAPPFFRLPDPDSYAPETGISDIFPAGRDPRSGEMWLTHCYGMVGVGRGLALDSGSGAELYTVIGHSPRPLDKVITVVGRVLKGMEHLAALPRGSGPLGFYEKPEQRLALRRVQLARDVPEAERESLEVLSGQSATYQQWLEARRQRQDEFFIRASGHIDVCNAMPPVRSQAK